MVLLAPVAVGDVLASGLAWADAPYILWLGLVATAAAYGLLILGMRDTSAMASSIVILVEPLTAAILAAIFFDERLGPIALLGAALLVAGMVLLVLRSDV